MLQEERGSLVMIMSHVHSYSRWTISAYPIFTNPTGSGLCFVAYMRDMLQA
jgi:hypothetical protein